MTDKTNTATSSATVTFPLATVLVVLLAVAKTQNIYDLGDLSWWWVFAPYWLGFVVFLAVLAIIAVVLGFVAAGAALLDARDSRKRKKERLNRLNRQ